MEAFARLCSMLENADECQFTLADLVAMLPPSTSAYSEKYLGILMKEKYGDSVVIFERPGKSSILCYRGQRFDQLGDQWYAVQGLDEITQRKRIVQKAAEIIRSDILSAAYDVEHFPTDSGVCVGGTALVPDTLAELLNTIAVKHKRGGGVARTAMKCEVIAHSIISAARPKSFFSPLHLGLGVWVHRKLGSKTLCDILSNMGSCCSYAIVQEFEKAATLNSSYDVDPEAYIQFAFDNFDFDTATLTGHGTFHSMGGMLYVTPHSGVPPRGPVPRLTKEQKSAPLGEFGVIPVQVYCRPPEPGFRKLAVADLRAAVLASRPGEEARVLKARRLDVLWMVGFCGIPHVVPAWNGFMSSVMNENDDFMVSSTVPLPFVNLNPSDPSTIFTCLMFAANQAKKQGQPKCAVTFDQPLFWKASEMVLAAPENSPLRTIVVRLGGFHLLMSFMGAVGNLMSGSGLEDLWGTVFAANSVNHMMTGKAYSRALRAHFMTQAVLLGIVWKQSNPAIEKEVIQLCLQILRGEKPVAAAENSESLTAAAARLADACDNLSTSSRTSKLWVQYIHQVDVMRMLIRAERLGDWTLHLHAVKEALPYFHAAGHLNYAKTAHLYLQQMLSLDTVQSSICDRFEQGLFTVRQADKQWGGNFSDQTIEMKLMRPMKSIGGISMHGRGITDSTLAVWVRTLPYCTQIIEALEAFCGVSSSSSEQHKELRDSRISRDARDAETFRVWLQQHNPFEPRENLVSLASGLVADTSVNCDEARVIGCRSMEKMAGKLYSDLTLQRKDKAVPLAAMTRTVTVRGSAVQVNPTQLFHRIIIVTKNFNELQHHFKYELAPFPTALFDDKGMRKTAKSTLVPAVESLFAAAGKSLPQDPLYVVDGGFLLRKVVWPRPAAYADVLGLYVSHVLSHYGKSARVIFDGYSGGPTTKDPEHNLRAAAGTCPDLQFEAEMAISTTQAKFLTNGRNKERLIGMLEVALHQAGVIVERASGDADRLIAVRAISLAQEACCVVVGTDTDLLVLLVGLSTSDLPLHFLVPGSGQTGLKVHNIALIKAAMGAWSSNILVAHALSGTDTVSAMYRGSKKKALQKICNEALNREAEAFLRPNQKHDQVAAAGERIILSLYGCSPSSNLTDARYHLYKKTIARQSVHAKFELAALPPTSEAAKQHSYRTYFQVQEWLGNDLNPSEWGWKLVNRQLQPVPTTAPPAPEQLLDLISCNCKAGCERGCPCAAALLKCTSICGQCAGQCANAEVSLGGDDDEEGEAAFEDVDDPDAI